MIVKTSVDVRCGLELYVWRDGSLHLVDVRLSRRLNFAVPLYTEIDVVGQIGTVVFRFCW